MEDKEIEKDMEHIKQKVENVLDKVMTLVRKEGQQLKSKDEIAFFYNNLRMNIFGNMSLNVYYPKNEGKQKYEIAVNTILNEMFSWFQNVGKAIKKEGMN
jgi:hypothetical protein